MKPYVPDRNELIWLDFEPPQDQAISKEIGKYRPALVLSSRAYNKKTGLLICCPVSSSVRGGATEVPVNNLEAPSVVAANLIQTLSWQDRRAQRITSAEDGVLEQVLLRIIPLIGADRVIERHMQTG